VIEVRGFNGKLNQDDNPYRLPKGDYTDALNITRDAQGDGQDEVVSNILGNLLVEDTLPPTGINKVIGNYADRTRNRLYYFTWNSNGYNRISYYDLTTDTITILLEDLTDTGNVGILNFDPSFRINHTDIVYRDDAGDLLFWTDGLNPPSKINVKTAETGGYGVVLRSYIDVAKEPPSAPPYCVYEDDINVTVNNLQNKQFKFKYRFVYDDNEKSVTSAQSEVPIPYLYSSQAVVTDPTKNADIFIAFQTGAENVVKIELLGAKSLGNTWSDFFLITVLDKAELGINSNDVSYFRFYNDKAYSIIPIDESLQPFDAVPQIAYTQSLPNGNVLDYGAITEGYDLIVPEYEASSSYIISYSYAGNFLILAYQNAQPAFNTGDIKIIMAATGIIPPSVGGANQKGQLDAGTISVSILDGVTPITLSASAGTGFFTFPLAIAPPYITPGSSIIEQFSTQAISNGFTIVSSNDNELVINKSGSVLQKTTNNSRSVPITIVAPSNYALNNNSQFAYNWNSIYSFGIVYFDQKGRTNSVIYSPQTSVQTGAYSENSFLNNMTSANLPLINLEINSRPPDWAYYFEIVRTKNLTKSDYLYWISEYTYKDTTAQQDGYTYAYISIANLFAYISANPQVKTIGYEFAPGDRIRFIKLYDSTGSTAQLYTSKDYEIIALLTDVELQGTLIKGGVLKIVLPPTSATFDFGTAAFANYLIEIYTPSVNFSNNVNLYYEFGERYIVGNPGTLLAYHEGSVQNQTENLSQPATYQFYKGDGYFRSRLILTGGQATLDFRAKSGIAGTYFPMANLVSNDSTHNGAYTINEVPSASNYQITINDTAVGANFIANGYITVKSSVNSTGAVLQLVRDFTGTGTWFPLGALTAGVSITRQITNYPLQITPGNTYGGLQLAGFTGEIIAFQLTLTDGRSIYQGIIDPNFSDNYDSAALPNGRPWIYNENVKREFNPTLIRFGGEYQPGTNINNINRFYEDDFDVYDRSRGSIKKMFIEGRNQYIFHQYDVGVVTVLTQIVRDTAGNPLSAESVKLLNKIVYPYIGQYGIGDIPESFAYGKHAKYFIDNNKGVVCRLSTDGITPLSILYKMNAFFVLYLSKYREAQDYLLQLAGYPTVYGAYDAYTNKYIIAMDAIYNDTVFVQEAYTLSFLESRDSKQGFESYLSFHPENMGDVNNLFITFLNGELWKHNNTVHCNFYANQYPASIETVFNDQPLDKKTYLAVMQTSSTVWYCPSIKSQVNSYGSTSQESSLSTARFTLLEGQYNSAILRDANSTGGIINGDTMKGNYLFVQFKIDDASSFYYINTVSLNYINSPLNVR